MNQQLSPQQQQAITAQWLQAVIGGLVAVVLLASLVTKIINELKGIREAIKS